MKREAKYTKAGNYLLRSKHSQQLVEFAILISAGRVRRNGKGAGAQVTKKDGTWAGNANWAMLMFLNRGLAEFLPRASGIPGSCQLTDLGKEMLLGAAVIAPSVAEVLRKIDNKKVD